MLDPLLAFSLMRVIGEAVDQTDWDGLHLLALEDFNCLDKGINREGRGHCFGPVGALIDEEAQVRRHNPWPRATMIPHVWPIAAAYSQAVTKIERG